LSEGGVPELLEDAKTKIREKKNQIERLDLDTGGKGPWGEHNAVWEDY